MCWLLNTAETDQFSWRPLAKEWWHLTLLSKADPQLTPGHSSGCWGILSNEKDSRIRFSTFLINPSLWNQNQTGDFYLFYHCQDKLMFAKHSDARPGTQVSNKLLQKSKVLNCWASLITDCDQILPREREESGVRWSKALYPSHSEHKEQGETILSV